VKKSRNWKSQRTQARARKRAQRPPQIRAELKRHRTVYQRAAELHNAGLDRVRVPRAKPVVLDMRPWLALRKAG
jgi:hypothetical protein